MENIINLLQKIDKIIDKDPRYKEEAYSFVLSGLNYAVSKLPEPRHVSAVELLDGIKEYAIKQFGPMTKTVLEYWGVKTTQDFGNIVFNMIGANLLGQSEKDSIDDFKNVFDFDEVFGANPEYSID